MAQNQNMDMNFLNMMKIMYNLMAVNAMNQQNYQNMVNYMNTMNFQNAFNNNPNFFNNTNFNPNNFMNFIINNNPYNYNNPNCNPNNINFPNNYNNNFNNNFNNFLNNFFNNNNINQNNNSINMNSNNLGFNNNMSQSSGKLKELLPREDKVIEENVPNYKGGRNINIVLQASTGLRVMISTSEYTTIEELLKIYVKRVNLPEFVINEQIVFIFNGEKLVSTPYVTVGQMFTEGATIIVADVGGIIGG